MMIAGHSDPRMLLRVYNNLEAQHVADKLNKKKIKKSLGFSMECPRDSQRNFQKVPIKLTLEIATINL